MPDQEMVALLQNTALWSVLSFLGALSLMLITGGPLISWLKRLPGMKWSAREDTPDTHQAKAGTPSIGGLGILGAAAVTFVLLYVLNQLVLRRAFGGVQMDASVDLLVWSVPLFALANMGLGFADDLSKARGFGGLRARDKFLGQIVLVVGFFAAIWLAGASIAAQPALLDVGNRAGILRNYPIWVLAFFVIVVLGTCNAVNLTDGIDGLAAGLCVQVGLAFGIIGLYGSGWWLCLAGACLGFLAYNRYPAKVFMGDTGSLALGAALGGAAVLGRAVWLLPFVGFIFYVELLSVTAQVLWFKHTRKTTGEGKRLFRRAPLHHHFELGGWSETRVVLTFWAINLCMTLLGLFLWNAGVLPHFP